MRLTLLPLMLASLALWLPAAHAQTEDEEILEEPASGQDSQPASARQSRADDELDDEELDASVVYSGMGVERVSTDFDNLGEATNLAAVIGFRVPTFPYVGLELDIGQTIIPGEYRDPEPGSPGTPAGCGPLGTDPCPATPGEQGAYDAGGREFGMQALGIGVAFKTMGKFYVTGKYGYRYIATSNDTVNEDRSGKGFAGGVGYRWGRGLSGVELGYKQLAPDVDSIGLIFYFRSGGRR